MRFIQKQYSRWFLLTPLLTAVTLIFYCCVPLTVKSQPKTDTLFINTNGNYAVNKHLYIYKASREASPSFVFDSVNASAFIKLNGAVTFNDIQHIASYYWLVLTIKNNLPHNETFYYQLNHPQLYSVIAYTKSGADFNYLGKSGFAYPFNQKYYHYYDNVFPLALKQGQSITILLAITISNGHNAFFAPQLSDTNTFKAKEEKFYMINGIITGIMVTAFLLNIFLGISLNEKLHYLYAFYIVCILYEIYLSQGLDSQYLYPGNNTIIVSIVRYVIPCFCVTLMAWVMQWFLNQKRSNSRIKLFVDIVNIACIGSTTLYLVLFFLSAATIFITGIFQSTLACLAIVQMVLLFASAVEKVIQGYKPAWFYIAAILCLFTGLIEYVLIYLGVNNATSLELRHPNDMQIGLVVETLIVFFGIVYRYNLFKKEKEVLLTEINTYQNSLINSIVTAQEEERKRIAEDLHDDVGATLSALAMHVSNIPDAIKKKGEIESYLNKSLFLSNKAVGDIRTIAHNLLPNDFKNTGLIKVLQNRIDDLNTLGKTNFTFIAEGNEAKLTEVFSITIYRIVNELLTNIIKHSMASEAAIQLLIEQNNIQIMVEDDGIGFNNDTNGGNGIGLKNITGRVKFLKGTINTDSSPNGTTTIINIPL